MRIKKERTPLGKIGFVSSYSDLCGNASYTRALAAEFVKRGFEVKILDLPQDLLRSQKKFFVKKADGLIQEYADVIRNLDAVNLQYEYGLFGVTPWQVKRRLRWLLAACKPGKFSVTMHRVDDYSYGSEFENALISLAKLNLKGFKMAWHDFVKVPVSRIGKSVLHSASKKNGGIIVHTQRERWAVENLLRKKALIYDHPISFSEPKIEPLVMDKKQKKIFCSNWGLNRESILIGVFGFISAYKGFETVLYALEKLPPNYVLVFFGGQHPASLFSEPHGSKYEKKLLAYIQKKKAVFQNRVLFLGAQDSDEQMVKAIRLCDHVVIPYFEVGQSGSGIVSLVFENNPNVYLSRNKAFLEYKKYMGESFYMFDIGNYLELADKIKNVSESQVHFFNRKKGLKKYNISSNVDVYIQSFFNA